jgi:hypothetical protein
LLGFSYRHASHQTKKFGTISRAGALQRADSSVKSNCKGGDSQGINGPADLACYLRFPSKPPASKMVMSEKTLADNMLSI